MQRNLTTRELECIKWMRHGKTINEIAIILQISRRTVEAHIRNIKAKWGCDTLFQLGVTLALNNIFEHTSANQEET